MSARYDHKLSARHSAAASTAFEIMTEREAEKHELTFPAIVMLNPKFAVNVASMIRNCAAFGVEWLFITGDRVEVPSGLKGDRLPRQERMRQFQTVKVVRAELPLLLFDSFGKSVAPIGVELTESSMPLPLLHHPDNAVYLLGPEDGSISKGWRAICHNIVAIPSKHCLNVAQAGGIVLYDRMTSRWREDKEQLLELDEDRGNWMRGPKR